MRTFNWKQRRGLGIGLGQILLIFLLSHASFAASATITFNFSQGQLHFSKWQQFDRIELANAEMSQREGAPQLPLVVRRVPVPSLAENLSIDVTPLDSVVLSGTFLIAPAQKPRILSDRGPISLTEPDPAIYNAATPYPQILGETKGAFSFFGKRFAEILLYPLRFLPRRKKVILYTQIQVKMHYTVGQPSDQMGSKPFALPPDLSKDIHNFLGEKVVSPPNGEPGEKINGNNLFPYLIITDESFVDAFRPLLEWKTKKGLRAKILTTQHIAEKYYGRDLAEKIRSCIGFYHQYHGTLWVLLGGDVRYVPLRYAWAMDCEAHYAPRENDIPADLYFSDLDGIWDANKNGIFGEVKDRINLYPDVFVGRFSASSPQNVETMAQKVLTYEKTPPSDFTTRMLFLAMILWKDPYTDSGEGKNYIGDTFVPDRFKPITKLYESRGNENVATVTDAINSGYNIINHDGHAWYNSMGMGENYFGLWDADHLQNQPRYSILFSIGCWPGAFDKDCMAEHLTRNPNGGMVAFIGNSRYGWGSPGNPKFGYSDRFDQQFFRQVFKNKVSHIGEALALAKAQLAPFARSANVYRWCEYEINLFGDPEMPVWTDNPKKLAVTLPNTVLWDSSQVTITVQDSATGLPVSNARVCFDQPGHVYATGFTAENGQFSFFLQGATADTTLWLTVTAPNFLPYEKVCSVRLEGRFVQMVHAKIDDSAGNGDGIVNPGETVRLEGFLKNFGTNPVYNLQAKLQKNSLFRSVSDSTLTISSLLPGDSTAFRAFNVQIAPSAKDGDVVPFAISLFEGAEVKWHSVASFVIGTPIIRVQRYRVDDRAEGDGNFMPTFGEHFDLRLYLRNEGHGIAHAVSVELIPDSIWLAPETVHFSVGQLLPGAQSAIQTRTYIQPGPFVPHPKAVFPLLVSHIACKEATSNDSIQISVGDPGFAYSPGQGCIIPWEMGGTGNLWHLSSYRTHADSMSWYCGDENSHRYKDNMNAYLRTIPFVADQKSELSFWAWYDVTVYGVDGFYVEAKSDTNSSWQVLDFIGSGGALNPFLMGNGWLHYRYDLSSIPAGTSMQIQFRFVSDGKDEAEGVYIERVAVHSQIETSVSEFAENSIASPIPEHFELGQNYPNPFNSSTVIEYALPEACRGGIFRIFNILGEEVYSRAIGNQSAGLHRLIWNGADQANRPLQTGLYFYQLDVGKWTAVQKMILLK